jgi:hypothetical protein
MVDHDGHRAGKTDEQAQLHCHQHNREDDADDRRGKAELVVKQVAGGEFEDQGHGTPQYIATVKRTRNFGKL